ncbi:MAG: hypothetical protein CME88_11680 [Hirschia sp.]|nr:hypothetical protein [Hirschia sp.]MBB37275.1 hypothetical protein [Hirschia sp.]MBF19029.1 hypothetical protein [Hirschia sp.]
MLVTSTPEQNVNVRRCNAPQVSIRVYRIVNIQYFMSHQLVSELTVVALAAFVFLWIVRLDIELL